MPFACASSKRHLEQALKDKFKESCGGKSTLSYTQFVNITSCRSELFAKRLFEAMDTDNSGDITFDEFIEMIHILQSRDTERRKKFIFDLFDLNRSGVITENELKTTLMASLEEGDISTTPEEREELSASLVRFFDMDEDNSITYEVFSRTLELYPDMLEGFSLEGIGINRSKESTGKKTRHKAWLWMMNHPQGIFTYSLLTLTLLGCFFWRFQRYMWSCEDNISRDVSSSTLRCQDGRKRELMGWSLPIAKGAGQAMKAIFTLILLPVSRNLMTNLRSTFLKYFFNFDATIDFHKTLGTVGFFLAWIHTLCHICDLKRWSDANRRQLYFSAFPEDSSQPSLGDLMKEQVTITGLTLITVYSIASLFALDYPRKLSIFKNKKSEGGLSKALAAVGKFLNNFNNFWYTHHLFAVFYIALVFHPTPSIPHERYEWAKSDSWVWILVPVAIYISERLIRAVMNSKRDTGVLSADILPGNVVELKMMKPRGLVYVAGQYVFLNCPQVSR